MVLFVEFVKKREFNRFLYERMLNVNTSKKNRDLLSTVQRTK